MDKFSKILSASIAFLFVGCAGVTEQEGRGIEVRSFQSNGAFMDMDRYGNHIVPRDESKKQEKLLQNKDDVLKDVKEHPIGVSVKIPY